MIRITTELLDRHPGLSRFVALYCNLEPGRNGRSGKWVLMHEPDEGGWIFRETPGFQFGFNGYEDDALSIVRKAVRSATKPAVYSFQSQEELDKWLNTPV